METKQTPQLTVMLSAVLDASVRIFQPARRAGCLSHFHQMYSSVFRATEHRSCHLQAVTQSCFVPQTPLTIKIHTRTTG